MDEYKHYISHVNYINDCKERGVRDGLSKAWSNKILQISKQDPSLLGDDFANFSQLIDEMEQKTGKHIKKDEYRWAVTVSTDYKNKDINVQAFEERCLKVLSVQQYYDVVFTIEVGKHAYDDPFPSQVDADYSDYRSPKQPCVFNHENVHAHFYVKTKQTFSLVEKKFREMFGKFIGCKQAILVKQLYNDDIEYLYKEYESKTIFLQKYGLKPLYYKGTRPFLSFENSDSSKIEKIKSFSNNNAKV